MCDVSLIRVNWWMERWLTHLCLGILSSLSWARGTLLLVSLNSFRLPGALTRQRECACSADWLPLCDYLIRSGTKLGWRVWRVSKKMKVQFVNREWINSKNARVNCFKTESENLFFISFFRSGKKSKPLFHLTLHMGKKVSLLRFQVLNMCLQSSRVWLIIWSVALLHIHNSTGQSNTCTNT